MCNPAIPLPSNIRLREAEACATQSNGSAEQVNESPAHTETGLNLDFKRQKTELFPPLGMATEVSKQVGRDLSSCDVPLSVLEGTRREWDKPHPKIYFWARSRWFTPLDNQQ